jgi:esterase/lipase superfamily enzyme
MEGWLMTGEIPLRNWDPAAEFGRAQSRARRNAWSIEGVSDQTVSLQTNAGADSVTVQGFEDISGYLERTHGIGLDICGGGYGCFEVVANARGAALTGSAAQKIIDDAELHRRLNVHGYDQLVVKGPEGEVAIEAVFPYDGFCFSNRKPVSDASGRLVDFSDLQGQGVSVARIAIEIAVHRHGERQGNLMRRVWRKILRRHNLRAPIFETRVAAMQLLSPSEGKAALRQALRAHSGGALFYIHGVNTTFNAAIQQWSGLCHHMNVEALSVLPIFFSWPAQQGKQAYLESVNYAMRSRVEFLEALQCIKAAAGGRPVNIVAHSHGCRLTNGGLLRPSPEANRKRSSSSRFHNLIYLAPDIDEKEFADDVPLISELTDRITVYTSQDDEALKLSALIWGQERTGSVQGICSQRERRIDFIDVSEVSSSLDGHSYFLDCAEVMEDMFHVLTAQADEVRSRQRRLVDSTHRRWRLLPTETPTIQGRVAEVVGI